MTESGGQGMMIWFDLTTPDTKAARAFYSALFGWTYEDNDRGAGGFYRVVSAGGRGIGGMISMAEIGMPDDDVPAHFMPYMYTTDVDGITTRAAELGSEVFAPPREIAGVSRFSVVGDPFDGVFAPMQTLMDAPPPAGDPPLGSVLWYEHCSPDPAGATKFYADLFGYTVSEMPMPFGTYSMLSVGETPIAGLFASEKGSTQEGWTIYVRVANIDESMSLAESLGGKLLTPAIDVPGTGRTALALDPTGAIVGLIEPSWL